MGSITGSFKISNISETTKVNYFNTRIAAENNTVNTYQTKPPHMDPDQDEEECSASASLAIVVNVWRWFAVAPLRVVRRQDSIRIRLSWPMCVYGYLLVCALNAILITGLVMDLNGEPAKAVRVKSKMGTFVWVIDLVIVSLITMVGVFGAPMRTRQMIPCVNQLNFIISQLKNNNNRRTLVDKKRSIITVVCFLIVLILCVNDQVNFTFEAIEKNKELTVVYLYGFYYVQVFMTVCMEMQFIFTALLAHTALQHINDVLLNLITSTTSTPVMADLKMSKLQTIDYRLSVPTKSINILIDSVALIDGTNYMGYFSPVQAKKAQETIRRLILSFTATCEVVRQIDSSHGLLLLLMLMSFLIHLVVTPYYFLTYLLSPKIGLSLVLPQLGWCLYHIAKMVLIVEPGHKTLQEITKTHTLVGHLMSRVAAPRDPLSAELELFCRQLELNKVFYCPMGMCVLTRPLIATILGGVTTYVVIIVQFQTTD